MHRYLGRGLLGGTALTLLSSFASAEVIFEHNGVTITEQDVVNYITTRTRPEVLETAVSRPMAIEQVIEDSYVTKRLGDLAVEQGAVDVDFMRWLGDHASDREALMLLIDQTVEQRFAALDWDALAEESYLADPSKYGSSETVNVDHILVSLEDRSWDEVVERIGEIRQKLASGVPFYEVAREYSDDRSVERNEGSLGDIARGATVPPFEQAAFAMETPGSLSEPVVTPFGVHIIRYNGRTPGKNPEFSQVRHLLVKDLKKAKRETVRQQLLNEARTELIGQDIEFNRDRILEMLGL